MHTRTRSRARAHAHAFALAPHAHLLTSRYAFALCAEKADEWEAVPHTLVLSGGVAANAELRRRVGELCARTPAPGAAHDGERWQLVVPPPRLCTDNGVMVAWAAIEAMRRGYTHEPEGQEVRARWPLGRAITDMSPHAKAVSAHAKSKTAHVKAAAAHAGTPA